MEHFVVVHCVVLEALMNAAKHADASVVRVAVEERDDRPGWFTASSW
jgi:signal transduction histidine kinase